MISIKRNVKTNRPLPFGAWLEEHKAIKWIDLPKYSEDYQKTLESEYEAYMEDYHE